jgi:hypothetical protein
MSEPRSAARAALALQQAAGNQAVTALLARKAPVIQRCGHTSLDRCPCHDDGGPADQHPGDRGEARATPASHDDEPKPVQKTAMVQRDAVDVAQAGEVQGPATQPDERGPTAGLLAEDDAAELQPNQMTKSEFLDRLQTAICEELDSALASVGRSTDGCPYLAMLFSKYRQQSGAEIERVLHRYAPATRTASSASDLIGPILQRVRGPVEHWVATGEITGVPDDAPLSVPAHLAATGSVEEGENAAATVQRKAHAGDVRAAQHPAAVLARLGPGRPLDQPLRHRMESAFHTSFADVRTHTDATADRLSSKQDARAFTVGEHTAFAAGEYRPGTPLGDALIAHELAHVVQQSSAGGTAGPDVLEEDADRSAVSAVASLWAHPTGVARRIAGNVGPVLRSGLQLQRCRKSEGYKKRPHEYHGAGGWLHANVYEPLQEDYAGWVRWGSNLAAEWGEDVPVGGHVAGAVVGFVPWVLGHAGQMVVSVPQFVTPKSQEEHFLFVVTGGSGPAAVRAGESVKYGGWWVRNLFKKKPKLQEELLEFGTHTVDDVAKEAAKRAPARTRNIPARKAPARGQSNAGGKSRVSSTEFFRTASHQELVEFVGGEDKLRQLSQQLNAAIGSAKGRSKRTIAIGLVREGPGHPPRLVYTASGNRGGGAVERTAEKLGVERWSISDSALRAKGRASRKHPHIPGAPGDAEQRLIEAANQNGMEVIAAVPTRKACPDCVEALAAEGALLINP